jgi:hypothetical protein
MLAVLQKPALKNRAAPISIKQYHQMIDAGVLTENDKVKLLGGMLVNKMPKSKLNSGQRLPGRQRKTKAHTARR